MYEDGCCGAVIGYIYEGNASGNIRGDICRGSGENIGENMSVNKGICGQGKIYTASAYFDHWWIYLKKNHCSLSNFWICEGLVASMSCSVLSTKLERLQFQKHELRSECSCKHENFDCANRKVYMRLYGFKVGAERTIDRIHGTHLKIYKFPTTATKDQQKVLDMSTNAPSVTTVVNMDGDIPSNINYIFKFG